MSLVEYASKKYATAIIFYYDTTEYSTSVLFPIRSAAKNLEENTLEINHTFSRRRNRFLYRKIEKI